MAYLALRRPLWVQDAVQEKRIILEKVAGDLNVADLMTKAFDNSKTLWNLVYLMNCQYAGGRSDLALKAALALQHKRSYGHGREREAVDRHAPLQLQQQQGVPLNAVEILSHIGSLISLISKIAKA